MSIVFILGILITAVFAASSYIGIRKHEKHDRVLFVFCQIRRDLMKELRGRFDSLSPQEYESAKFLLDMLNKVIQHYRHHKTSMFNLRTIRREIEKDLQRYRTTQQQVQKHLSDVPKNTKIAELYANFSRAAAMGFLAYTPFILWEIVFRILWAEGAKQIAQIRQERESFGEKLARA